MNIATLKHSLSRATVCLSALAIITYCSAAHADPMDESFADTQISTEQQPVYVQAEDPAQEAQAADFQYLSQDDYQLQNTEELDMDSTQTDETPIMIDPTDGPVDYPVSTSVSDTPEPSGLMLLATGLIGLSGVARKRIGKS